MSTREFLQLPESPYPLQLINGEIWMAPSPEDAHQVAAYELAKLIERLAGEGLVRLAPLDVVIDEANVVQPDVFWVSEGNSRCQRVEGRWQGPPDLVIEVLSPGTALVDKGAKFRLYEAAGVGEYWLVDPAARYVEVWRRDGDLFAQLGVFGPADTFQSPILGGKQVAVGAVLAGE
jgi:Uma2 family endonuclease